MAPNTSTLESMPNELLLEIAKSLQPKDVLNLRAAGSKKLANAHFSNIAKAFYPVLRIPSNITAYDANKEYALLATLENSSESIAKKVKCVIKDFPTVEATGAPLNRPQHVFLGIVARLPHLEMLELGHLDVGKDGYAFDDILAAIKSIPSLASIKLRDSVISSSTLRALLKLAPNLKKLAMNGCTCLDDWATACSVVGESTTLEEVELSRLCLESSARWYFPLCGEGKAVDSEGDLGVRPKVKNFRVDGKWQQYVLKTLDISYIKGNVAVKEAMKYLAGVEMKE